MSRKQQVLVVDDDAAVRRLVRVRLKPLNVELLEAANGVEGIQAAQTLSPDLILLDVSMPGMDGFEVCRQLRNDTLTCEIPVIFLTGADDAQEKLRGFELGAVDYVTKPFHPIELTARVRSALRTQALLFALETQAEADGLTGLPNRSAFHRAVSVEIERYKQDPRQGFGVIFLDLDDFKIVNDSLGHQVGDELLVEVANRISAAVWENQSSARCRRNLIARMGGDEFTILVTGVADVREIIEVAERIRDRLGERLQLQGYGVVVNASLGVRMADPGTHSACDLLRDSDTATYRAKAAGKNGVTVFDKNMYEQAYDRLELEHDILLALDNQELSLRYQPIIDMENARVIGFEALMRWRHPRRGMVSSDVFIPIAEGNGEIVRLGDWALNQAVAQLAEWRRTAGLDPSFRVSVNLSRAQLRLPDFDARVRRALQAHGVPAENLMLEITESVIMEEAKRTIPLMESLRRMGVRLAMDDFGTGYSSLSWLFRFPLDVLKIDREFIRIMTKTRSHAALVNTIIGLADNLSMDVVAEGIETADQAAQLLAMDCRMAQGSLFGKPMDAQQARDLMMKPDPFAGLLNPAHGQAA